MPCFSLPKCVCNTECGCFKWRCWSNLVGIIYWLAHLLAAVVSVTGFTRTVFGYSLITCTLLTTTPTAVLLLIAMNFCADICCQCEKQKYLFGCTPSTNIEPDNVNDVKEVVYLTEKLAVRSLPPPCFIAPTNWIKLRPVTFQINLLSINAKMTAVLQCRHIENGGECLTNWTNTISCNYFIKVMLNADSVFSCEMYSAISNNSQVWEICVIVYDGVLGPY